MCMRTLLGCIVLRQGRKLYRRKEAFHAYPAKYGFESCSFSLMVVMLVRGLLSAKGERAGDSLFANENAELKTSRLVSLALLLPPSPGKDDR